MIKMSGEATQFVGVYVDNVEWSFFVRLERELLLRKKLMKTIEDKRTDCIGLCHFGYGKYM